MLCNRLNIADNGYFTFQAIINIAEAHCTISDAVCVGSLVINYKNKIHKKLEFSTRVGTIKH